MRLILVRHGQTDWNKQYRIQGQSDMPLNANGLEQAEALGARLKDEPLDAVFCSPLQRARRTALAIAHPHQLEVRELDGLKELDTGKLDGLYYPDISVAFPDFAKVWFTDPALARAPGGENLPEVQSRAWASVEEICTQCQGMKAVALVSHYFVISTILCRMFEMSLSDMRRFRMSVAGFSVLRFFDGPVKLESFNDTCHLG